MPGGAVVPTAGITWITVAPTHRRRGVLTAIMRRQLDEVHEQGREPVAALWAAEASIYGRFGYAPASFRGGWTGRTERLRLRRDVDTGTGRVRLVDVDEFRAAAVGLHDAAPPRACPATWPATTGGGTACCATSKDDRHGYTERRHVLHEEADGTVTGYAVLPDQVLVDRHERTRRHAAGRRGPRDARRPATPRCGSTCCRTTSCARSTSRWRRPTTRCATWSPTPAPCTPARSTRCGCGWSTSTGRCRPAATRRRSTWCSRSATSSAPGTPAAGGCPGHPAGAYCGPHRPRSRHRARHRGAVVGLPGRRLARLAAGGGAGVRGQPGRGHAGVDGVRLAGRPVVPRRVLTPHRPTVGRMAPRRSWTLAVDRSDLARTRADQVTGAGPGCR